VKKIALILYRVISLTYVTSPKYFILVFIFSMLRGISPVASLWAMRELINTIADSTILQQAMITKTLIIFFSINFIVRVNNSLVNYFTQKQRLLVEFDTSISVLEKCEKLNVSDFENGEKYNVIAKGENEGRVRIYSTYQNLLGFVTQIVSLTSVIFAILSWKSYVFLLVLIVPFLTTVLNTYINYKYYEIRMKRMQLARKTSYIRYLLTNDLACKEIKAYQTGGYLIGLYHSINTRILKQDNGINKQKSYVEMLTSFIDESISILVLLQIIKMSVLGVFKIGDTVAYFDSLGIVQVSVTNLLNLISSLSTDTLYVSHFFELIDMQVENDTMEGIKINEIDSIEFKNVSFSYQARNEFVIRNVSFQIRRGESIVIVGDNGSGKSTLVKLICGFYSTYYGEILINDIELSLIDKKCLRSLMGIVFQDFNKYELTLRENIGFGSVDQINEDDLIWGTLKKVELDQKVLKFGSGLDAQMGHWFNGEQLSKGQWQRIALARAFIQNRSAYIFDEPTSSLDPNIEREIYKLMKSHGEGKICIFVTHRFVNIDEFNPRVMLISNGIVENDARHSDLIKISIKYNDLLGNYYN